LSGNTCLPEQILLYLNIGSADGLSLPGAKPPA